MSVTRDQVVEEALSWVGTPWHHQAALKGIGCDCVGFVAGVQVALGLMPADFWRAVPGAAAFFGYGRTPDGRVLTAAQQFLVPTDGAQPGDVIVAAFGDRPAQHVGIMVDDMPSRTYWVHAENKRHSHVRKTRLLFGTERMRLVGAFRIPGVA